MTRYHPNLVIAVDGSPPSIWALHVGAALAAKLRGRVTLVHAVVPPSLGASEVSLMTADVMEGLKAEGFALLDGAARRLPAEALVGKVLREGAAAPEIVAQARETGADFIVMGSRGRGRWSHFILGSTAEAVIRQAPCPVITVSHDPNPSTGAELREAWAEEGATAGS